MTMKRMAAAVVTLVVWLTGSPAGAQEPLVDLLQRYGVTLPSRGIEGAFDEGMAPAIPVSAGAFATPLAILATASGHDRIAAAYTFGILAGRSAQGAAPGEVAAAGQACMQMMVAGDRQSRVAGARVAGRIFAVALSTPAARVSQPAGLVDALFLLLNRPGDFDRLAAMDALGLVRATIAVSSLTDRYHFHRDAGRRALAGGALEDLARIGHPSSVEIAKALAGDRWADGRDATALAVAFARERLLQDGSLTVIQQALGDKSRRAQARGYLAELGAPAP